MSPSASDAADQMNRIYRYQRGIYDLTRRYYLLGRSTLISGLTPPDGGSILEVGCGTASNLIRASQTHPNAGVLYGFDVSSEMLATAIHAVTRAKLDDRIRLACADATNFDGQSLFGVHSYDRVFASYMLSMVPDWPAVIEAMARQLAHGGSIHIVDFGDCANLPEWFRVVLYRWLAAFHVTPRLQLTSVLEAFAEKHSWDLKHESLLGGYAQYAVLTRKE